MRVLLSQRLPCFPALTGAAKGTLHMLKGLAQRDHVCRIVALAGSEENPDALVRLRAHMADQEIQRSRSSSGIDVYDWMGMEVHAVADGFHLWTHLAEQIREFHPGCVLVGEDRSFLGLATALQEAGPARVVYLAHSQASLPFGPEGFFPDSAKTEMLGQAAGILAPSRYVRDYIRQWSGLRAELIQLPSYGSGPFPDFSNFDSGFVTLVNASQVKGVCILEELACTRPRVEFAAVPTWATTTDDLQRLSALRNLRLLAPSQDIDVILAKTRVLLVPSLWGEAFGRIVVEAMLRGIPVLASNIGGLPEAKLGVDYLLPVRPIQSYSTRSDDRALPIPLVPEQDITPWLEALDRLLTNRAHYREVSSASRVAAVNYVSCLTIAPCEEFLHRLASKQPIERPPLRRALPGPSSPDRLELLEVLVKEHQSPSTTGKGKRIS